jgi:hypothetical protein
MEAVVFCGLQGAGKTTLYRDRFAETHVRISMDLLRTRHREAEFLRLCLETQMRFVVDNTNPTAADRRRYVEPARAAGFKVVGYLVEADVPRSVNAPPHAAAMTARRFVRPAPEEGFDELWHATGRWRIEPLVTTPPLF